jgi:hypothetical protein
VEYSCARKLERSRDFRIHVQSISPGIICAIRNSNQLEDRQHYERLNFECQQDEQSKSLMNQELNQQTKHASSAMGILQELDCFFVMLSRRLYGMLTEDEIDEE